ncbi:MAG TPA: AAA family ATPase, partial [Candidatus Rokubacteria bacterium]|nr:AAA family ATPase [Candidatus Rokubacteria bacterium]
MVERLRGLTLFEAERALRRAILRDRALTSQDLEYLAELKRELLRQDGLLEYFTAEERLADVGGFRNLKAWLAKRSRALSPEAKQFGLEAPKGILLLGVQGCGKTLVARTVAREWGLPLLKLETGRVYDKYVGESEKNLEKALAAAEHMAPCVLMLDEIEKGLTLTSGASDAGLSRRIFGR